MRGVGTGQVLLGKQVPFWQTSVGPHTVPSDPQLASSALRSMQVPFRQTPPRNAVHGVPAGLGLHLPFLRRLQGGHLFFFAVTSSPAVVPRARPSAPLRLASTRRREPVMDKERARVSKRVASMGMLLEKNERSVGVSRGAQHSTATNSSRVRWKASSGVASRSVIGGHCDADWLGAGATLALRNGTTGQADLRSRLSGADDP